MPRNSTAKRTNLILAAVVAAIVTVAAAAAIAGRESSSESSPATVTTLVVTGPASVEGAWFGPVSSEVAVDYPVESLTCPNMALHLTLDLCAVADGDTPFLVVGQEGYWSPDEPDLDGTVRIPFDLTVYVAAETDDGRVARPVLSAVVSLPYDGEYNELSLQRPSGPDLDGVIALVWSARSTLQDPALDAVQVLAVVDQTPTIVATEIGTEIHVGSADDSVLLVAPTLGADTQDPLAAPTLSVVSLRADGDRWSRRLSVTPATTPVGDFIPAERLNSYGFPRAR